MHPLFALCTNFYSNWSPSQTEFPSGYIKYISDCDSDSARQHNWVKCAAVASTDNQCTGKLGNEVLPPNFRIKWQELRRLVLLSCAGRCSTVTAEPFSHNSNIFSYLIVTFVLCVVGVPYSDDYVGGAEVKIGVICNVIDADVLLDSNDLEVKQEKLMTRLH